MATLSLPADNRNSLRQSVTKDSNSPAFVTLRCVTITQFPLPCITFVKCLTALRLNTPDFSATLISV